MNKYRLVWISIIGLLIFAVGLVVFRSFGSETQAFSGARAFDDVKSQLSFGPRTMGSNAHEQTVNSITSSLQDAQWMVEIQETKHSGQTTKNIIAKRGNGTPWIILGSHYDSRYTADHDPTPANRSLAVPGANDGASTVAILLELARVIPANLDKQIWLVFLDNEDNGDNSGAGWSIGAQDFVSSLQSKPDRVVILDMLGQKDLTVYMEKNSDPGINSEIWAVAKELGYSQFVPTYKYNMIDDHIPFLKAGIRAVDLIDFDYPYWHTTQDTLDKISPESLKIAGDTVLQWLKEYPKER